MSDGMTLVMGIGIVSGMLFLLSLMIDDQEHGILKFFFIMVILSLMLLIPKSFGDEMRNCETVVANSTAVTASITAYEYTSYCFTETSTTNGTFMQIVFWVYRAIIAYLLVYFFIQACKAMLGMRGGRM